MRATVSVTVGMAGETATSSKTKTQDGVAAATPTATPAAAGTLTTRTSSSAGVVTTDDTTLVTGDVAILTWVDPDDGLTLKHRYNVDCDTVAAYVITFSGGSGDDLPVQGTVVNASKQIDVDMTFDPEDVEVFCVSTNVRGVCVFLDGTDTEKLVTDMGTGEIALWTKVSGFTRPFSGTPITRVLVGSGDTSTTSFLPKILCLYEATGSGV